MHDRQRVWNYALLYFCLSHDPAATKAAAAAAPLPLHIGIGARVGKDNALPASRSLQFCGRLGREARDRGRGRPSPRTVPKARYQPPSSIVSPPLTRPPACPAPARSQDDPTRGTLHHSSSIAPNRWSRPVLDEEYPLCPVLDWRGRGHGPPWG